MKNIVAPTDFSASANKAAHYAAQLAKATGARLHLFHVFHVPIVVSDVPVVPSLDGMEQESLDKLEAIANEIQDMYGITAIIKADVGFSVDEIANYGEKVSADLIVMGLQGHGKTSDFLLGSTSTAYVERSTIPVLIVPTESKFVAPQWITLATDLREIEIHTLDVLKDIATFYKSKINIVNVSPGLELPDFQKSVAGIKLDRYFQELNHLFFFPDEKNVIKGMDEFMSDHQTDWIAMIPRKHGFFDRMFGKSITKKMAYHTQVPLLILPEKPYTDPIK